MNINQCPVPVIPNSSKNKLSFFILLFTGILTAFFLTISATRPASADMERLFDTNYLKGVDTILVSYGGGPNSNLMPWPKVTYPAPPSIFILALKDIFSEQAWIKITEKTEPSDFTKPNVITFQFSTTVRESVIDGKSIKAGTLSILIWRGGPHSRDQVCIPSRVLANPPISYPFIVPATTDELNKTLTEGVRFLTLHLPRYFACGNNVGSDPCQWGPRPYGYDDFDRGITR